MRIPDLSLQSTEATPVRLRGLLARKPATIVALVRHFGWIFCREELAQLRDANDAIQEAGGQVIAVGMGTPAMAADAAATGKLPFTLLVDQNMDLYQALQARRGGVFSMLNFGVLSGAFRAWQRGHRQSGVRGDPMQLGATAVADRAGELLAVRLARDPADHPPIEWILEAVRTAQTR